MNPLLLRLASRALPIALTVALAFTAKACYDGGVRANAERAVYQRQALAEQRDLVRRIDSLRYALDQRVAALRVAESTYHALSKPFRETITVHDTAWFTQRVTDTVTVETVREIVRSADETINACHIALDTCATLQARKDSLLAVKDRLIATMPKPTPAWKRWLERAAVAGVAYELGRAR